MAGATGSLLSRRALELGNDKAAGTFAEDWRRDAEYAVIMMRRNIIFKLHWRRHFTINALSLIISTGLFISAVAMKYKSPFLP